MNPNHPTQKRPIVCLDAGHFGKYNRSPVAEEYYESEGNWKLQQFLKKELESWGIQVKTTRQSQERDLALEARGEASANCDLFLSLHANAADRETVKYVLAIYQTENGKPEIEKRSREIGEKLAQTVGRVMNLPWMAWSTESSRDRDGNGLPDDYYGVLRGAHRVETPGVILEHGFYTHPETVRWLLTDENLEKLAVAEAESLAAWFGVSEKEALWYRIRRTWEDGASQLGAYRSLELAKENCPAGYSVFDWFGVAVFFNGAYDLQTFIGDVQRILGANESEILEKTITLSAKTNAKHPLVQPVQRRLLVLGYSQVGNPDGIAGPKFTEAVKTFQRDHDCVVDGEITARNKTWRKLLGME